MGKSIIRTCICDLYYSYTPYSFSIMLLHFDKIFCSNISRDDNCEMFQVDFAFMLDVDSLGFNVKVVLYKRRAL
jgi:hypothetical protein